MNTSMTINATACWLMALYVAVADEQGAPRAALTGTTQNDIIKEYLSRGTYVFPPAPSMRLTKDVILFTTKEMPKWNPMNVCSYHLQEAGATPVQELAFALATAIGVLDAVKASGNAPKMNSARWSGDFVLRQCRTAFHHRTLQAARLHRAVGRDHARRYGVTDLKQRRSAMACRSTRSGLTEQQPENNVARILLEMLAVTLSKDARARAVQLPAWNEALGLPRPWDQQWSLRMQQILAYETDLLGIWRHFRRLAGIAAKVADAEENREGRARGRSNRWAARSRPSNSAIHRSNNSSKSNSRRVEAIERGEQTVVGVNRFVETEPSPLADAGGRGADRLGGSGDRPSAWSTAPGAPSATTKRSPLH